MSGRLRKRGTREPTEVRISSRDYWVKVVEMLQQNWALIDGTDAGGAVVFFVTDGSGVFDRISFPSLSAAKEALQSNGFKRFAGNPHLEEFLRRPPPPFHEATHPNGPIYSSGRFWIGENGCASGPQPDKAAPGDDVQSLAFSGRLRVATDPGRLPPPSRATPSWDRVSGMLLGLAIGDSLGNTSESQNPSDRRAHYGEIRDYLPNRFAEGRRVGLPSDDTQLAFWTLEHLLERGTVDPPRLAECLASRRIFGIGSTVREFLNARRDDSHWLEAAQESAGNGALMRIAPVLLPYLGSPRPEVWRDAVVAGAVTHNDFASNASCAALIAVLQEALVATTPVLPGFWLRRFVEVARVLEGDVPRYAPRAPLHAHRHVSLWQFTEEVVGQALSGDVATVDACDGWYSGAYLLETVPSVLYILERHGNDAEEAIIRAVNDTRDNDTVAAIVGAAVGALHGGSKLPGRWREGLLGRTGADDDGRVQELVAEAEKKWG